MLFLKNHIKHMLLLGLLIPFLLIYFQQIKPFTGLKPLKGYFIPKSYSTFNVDSWFSGTYQSTTDEYIKEEFGFRNAFVRLHNQLSFWFFGKANLDEIIIGKENYLFEEPYIDALKRKEPPDFKGLNDTLQLIKRLQDTLKLLGKEMIIVLAPSKARIYSEYIPDDYKPLNEENSYYNFYCKALSNYRIQYIDFNSLFLKKKSTSKYLLFPKLGIHWSRLEAVFAADSMFKYLAWKSNCNLPKLEISDIKEIDTLQMPDNDIIESMNLLFFPDFDKMAYPLKIKIDSENKSKRNLMVISDSYWWDIYSRGIPKDIFENNEFLYYNNQLFGNNYMGDTDPKKIDIKRHILNADHIILLFTEPNLDRLGFGFIGSALSAMKRNIQPTNAELKDIIDAIKNNKEWCQNIAEKSIINNISADSMMTIDAMWYFQREGPLKKELFINDVKSLIKSNPVWIKNVHAKAKQRGLSIDSMMTLDAIWYIQQQK